MNFEGKDFCYIVAALLSTYLVTMVALETGRKYDHVYKLTFGQYLPHYQRITRIEY